MEGCCFGLGGERDEGEMGRLHAERKKTPGVKKNQKNRKIYVKKILRLTLVLSKFKFSEVESLKSQV